MNERVAAAPRARRRRADPRLAELGVDGHRAVRSRRTSRSRRSPRTRSGTRARSTSSPRASSARRRRARVRPHARRVPLRTARRAAPARVGADDRAALALRDSRRDPARGAASASDDPELAGLAAKIDREEVYHRIHAEMWVDRLLGSDEGRGAARRGARGALAVCARRARRRAAARAAGRVEEQLGRALPDVEPVARGDHEAELAELWDEMTMVRRSAPAERPVVRTPGSSPGRAGRVDRARRDPRPGDPGDLARRPRRGRGRRVSKTGGSGRLHADVHGLPGARDDARADGATRSRELGAEPDVRVVLDDSWSTDRISPEGREKLRAAGFAPPAPRSAGQPTLVQLQRGPFRCPYCGSTDTRLENIFGPTPCRSLRYCNACRQPFEQFKTI